VIVGLGTGAGGVAKPQRGVRGGEIVAGSAAVLRTSDVGGCREGGAEFYGAVPQADAEARDGGRLTQRNHGPISE